MVFWCIMKEIVKKGGVGVKDFAFHYLDNSATTNVCAQAAAAATAAMTQHFGNPSSLHTLGFEAEQLLLDARKAVAGLLKAKPEEIVFTSGGTEANNLALFGCARAQKRRGQHIITTAVEHPSVSVPLEQLEKEGFTVTRLMPDENGMVTAAQVAEACRPDTVLVSVMLVNNETGARFPIEEMVSAVRRRSPLAKFHTDAVQAAGRLALSVDKLGVDMLTLSGHKFHAPKGSGALYCRTDCRLLPHIVGGGQQQQRRSGTEAVPAWVALGEAVRQLPTPATQNEQYSRLAERLMEKLTDLPDVRWHRPTTAVPYILHFSVMGLRSETLLHFLAQRQVFVSSGSACAKGKRSPVLTAMGLSEREADSSIRVSLSRYNDENDIDALAEGLLAAVVTLQHRR